MLPEILRGLHLTKVLYLVTFGVLLLVAVVLGFVLARISRACVKRFQNTWLEFVFALLQPLPIPLLVLAALYTALELLTLPPSYERMGSKVISCFVILAVYYFPARVVVLFVRRIGYRRPGFEDIAQFVAAMTRALFVLLALYTVFEILQLPPKYERFGSKLTEALSIALVFFALSKIAVLYLNRLSQREPALRRVTDPAVFVARLIFAILAAIILLENFNIHLTAVWTTLGLGSVAVALALQETLSNLFAGLYLLVDRPISPGDYIKLDGGHEGYVLHVGWRSTKFRTLQNNMVVVPNSIMSKAIITNYSTPIPRMAVSLTVGVAYGTDPNRVEGVLLDIAKTAAEEGVKGLLADPEPLVRFIPGFGASSMDFSLVVQVGQFSEQYLVQHELRKRIIARFRQEGIDMPYPTQHVLLDAKALEALGHSPAKIQEEDASNRS